MSNGPWEISMKKLGGQGSGCTNRKLMPTVFTSPVAAGASLGFVLGVSIASISMMSSFSSVTWWFVPVLSTISSSLSSLSSLFSSTTRTQPESLWKVRQLPRQYWVLRGRSPKHLQGGKSTRASNEGSRRFHNQGLSPDWKHLLELLHWRIH